MKEYIINQNDADKRLDRFVLKVVPRLSGAMLYKYIRTKRIKVNDKKSLINYHLQLNDVVKLYINDELFITDEKNDYLYTNKPISIVYEDDNIMLVNKPVGLVVHEDNENTIDTLINRVLYYLHSTGKYIKENENSFTPALCNRIDRNTTGIVIVAKNAVALRFMNEVIKNREIKKKYLCIVSGVLQKKEDTLTHYMIKDETNNQVFVYDKSSAITKTMITKYKVLKNSMENTLVEIELVTGRTHQIRAQFAHINHPVLGDGKYGRKTINKKYNLNYQLLCSYKLKFDFKENEQYKEFEYLNHREFSLDDIWFADEFSSKY